MARSTNAFEMGWHGAVLTCFMPFIFKNGSQVKFVSLSETRTSGNPKVEKDFLTKEMVATDEDTVVGTTWNVNP